MAKSGRNVVKGPMPGRSSEIVNLPLQHSGGADGQKLTQNPSHQERSTKPRPGSAGEKAEKGDYFGTP